MGSDTSSSAMETSGGRSSPPRKTKSKIPKRIHKAEREKQKREHLNELFQDLANALELNQPNNGKASILCDATRLLKEISGQIDDLKKENVTLLSESRYVMVETSELKIENSALEAQVDELRSEVLTPRVSESKPDLNVPPLCENEESGFPFRCLHGEAPLPPTVLIVPINPDQCASCPVQLASQVSKPNPRYATPADSWPFELLREPLMMRKEAQLSGGRS